MTQFTLSAFADEASPEFDRQIAALHPKKLAILDIYENNAYDVQQELIRKYGDKLNLEVIIASVRRGRQGHFRPDGRGV